MKKLAQLVTVEENNQNCVLLKVKPKTSWELMKLGYFYGNEQYIRVTKSKRFCTHTGTVWRKDEKPYSWCWGSESTCVSDSTNRMRNLIVECIENDLGISLTIKE